MPQMVKSDGETGVSPGRRYAHFLPDKSMQRPSFAVQIVMLWGLIAAMCAALLAVIWFMASSAESYQTGVATQLGERSCVAVANRYEMSLANAAAPLQTDLMHAVLDLVLVQLPGVEGGFWTDRQTAAAGQPAADKDAAGSFLAYSFPTYQGSGIKRDIPQAETPLILRMLLAAADRGRQAGVSQASQGGVVVTACPVRNQPSVYVWTMTRPRPVIDQLGVRLLAGASMILALILAVAVLLALGLRRWRDKLSRLEAACAPQGAEVLPGPIAPLGEPDLDRIVDALNRQTAHAQQLRGKTLELGQQLAQAERFSALGKLAAQVAHEIRNPVGAMRLRAENALAGNAERQQLALHAILGQLGRIESQVASLLALTQPVRIHLQQTRVQAWLAAIVAAHEEEALRRGVSLAMAQEPEATFCLDPEQLRRAVDNLVLNALRHAGAGGHVTVAARSVQQGQLAIEVADDGPGVPPDQRQHIFEPFVSGAAAGSGLGLAVVREVAAAHGGRAYVADSASGARFIMEIPWQPCS